MPLPPSPGGYATAPGLPVDQVTIQGELRAFPGADLYAAGTRLEARVALGGRAGVVVAVPLVVAPVEPTPYGELRQADLEVGLEGPTLGARAYLTRPGRGLALGMDLRFPGPTGLRVDGAESAALAVAELSFNPDRPISLRLGAGARHDGVGLLPAVDFAASHVIPVAGPLSAVVEVESVSGPEVTARVLARVDLASTHFVASADVGAQAPAQALGYPQGAVIGQVRILF